MSKNDKQMTFTGHLIELRQRLIKSAIALVIAIIISFTFAGQILEFLIRPAPDDIQLVYTQLTGFVGPYMKVALAGGIVLAMPFFVYQFIMFVSPALTRREKRYVYFTLPWITLMFAGGVAFAYFILVPPATNFLLTWRGFSLFGWDTGYTIDALPTIGDYISVATRFMVAIGIVFETPVIITFLARLGIVKPEWLASKRRWWLVIAFILAAIITPTFDPINQSLVAVPLIILYEMSIWLAKIAYRKRVEAGEDYLSD